MIRTDWVWLSAAIVVAGAVLLGFVAFGVYEGGHRDAATAAFTAELAASEINALEWQSIATGEIPAGAGAELSQWLAAVDEPIVHQRLGAQTAAAHAALGEYLPAIREEFRLIRAGQLSEARRVDEERVDPAYEKLREALKAGAAQNAASADDARRAAIAGEIAVIVVGLAVASLLVFRFAGARRALAVAEVKQRMLLETSKAKSDLISVVSHDLRTPLTSIVGYLEIVSGGDAGPVTEDQQQFLSIIQRNADRLLTIVNDLLFISRAEQHQIVLALEEISLEQAASEVVQAQQLRARAREIDLRFTASPAPSIRADPDRLAELIENLLSNAIKFTQPGGSVVVAVGAADERVWLEVTDTGAGISPADQEHLFERFFRSPRVTGTPGTGLGLAIVKAIADAHGATLEVRSVLGEGSTFRVEFPQPGTSSDVGPESSG